LRIRLGSDHAGFALKQQVKEYLSAEGHEVVDVGPDSEESVDYPLYAEAVAGAVADGDADFGVLVCGTGLGMAIAANKVDGVRAVQVSDPEFARMARLHNDANVVTLPGRYIDIRQAGEIVDTFLGTAFEGGRHQRRVDMIGAIGAGGDEGEQAHGS
jgi:ribose 5-phosphate isomerase B